MRLKRRGVKLFALVLGLSLVAAACGSDDDPEATDGGTATTEGSAGVAGGDFIDLGTIVGDPLEHIDPALNSTLDAYQIINAMYDGLTDISTEDPDNPEIVPHVAESFEANDDASVWTFTIREGQAFDSGEEILPSTFQNSWERAADLAGDYSYLLGFIDGGTERLDGTADTISGIEADDEAMTLTVTLDAPYSNFHAVAGFQLFMPVPQEAIDAGADWENQVMFGNGPYKMESARNDQAIKLIKSDSWTGDYNQETWDDRLDSIEFRVTADPDTSYNSFEAGEGHNANIPPARAAEADENYGTTLDVSILGSYHWVLDTEEGPLAGEENLKLRQAISSAIDRDEINEAVYSGTRTSATGVTPNGIPGFAEGLCEYCTFDLEQAQTLFDEWKAEGNELTEPIPLQFNADAGHEPVAQIVISNLAEIGIEAVAEPMPGETYFSDLADGACKAICRAGWFADYPTYDNFMYDLFHSDSIGGNNLGVFNNEEFDALIDEAKQTTDADEQAQLFQDAEKILLNEDTGVIPMNWYRGDYAYSDEIASFPQTNFGLIIWEQVAFAE
ncbi:MAG: peptide ABC transporter substrate-binding protein [Actinomycetota bacterium]